MSQESSIAVSKGDRCRLGALIADGGITQRRQTRRAEVVLLSADGACLREIMLRTGRSKTFILRWQERFLREGYDGLLRNKKRSDRIDPTKAETAQKGKALMLVGSIVDYPPRNRSVRAAVLSELMRIDDQLAELSNRLESLEHRSSIQRGGFAGYINASSIVNPRLFSEGEENSFAAHVAFGMSKSRMNG